MHDAVFEEGEVGMNWLRERNTRNLDRERATQRNVSGQREERKHGGDLHLKETSSDMSGRG